MRNITPLIFQMKIVMIKCQVCGQENPENTEVCSRCGVVLVQAGLPATGELEIRLPADHAGEKRLTLTIAAPISEGYVFGRSEEGNAYQPDIDLTPFRARSRGVSRRHAALVRYHGLIHLLDLHSINGTFLNGKRLSPDLPALVGDGDQVRLGMFQFSIARAKIKKS